MLRAFFIVRVLLCHTSLLKIHTYISFSFLIANFSQSKSLLKKVSFRVINKETRVSEYIISKDMLVSTMT